jgi:hypothetical protein
LVFSLYENETTLLSPFGRGARGKGLATFHVTLVNYFLIPSRIGIDYFFARI